MRYLLVIGFGLLWMGRLQAQNHCYAWYDLDSIGSIGSTIFGRWLWSFGHPRIYYVRPGGDYVWFGSDTLLNWSWWGTCGQGSRNNARRVPIYINLSAGDSCILNAGATGYNRSGACTDSLTLLIVAHPGAWGHCYAQFSLNGTHRPPGSTYTLPHAGTYSGSLLVRSEWRYTSSFSVRWRLSGPVNLDTTLTSQSLSSPSSLALPLLQPGLYTLTVGYFVYEGANNGCEDTLRYYIQVLQDSIGAQCPNLPDTLHFTVGSHRIVLPLGYSTALYTWNLTGPSGSQNGSGTGDSIIVSAQFSSPGWHYLTLSFYSPNAYHCHAYIPIYVTLPTVRPCVAPTVRPCQPLVTINNATLSPYGGFYALCSGRTYTLCVSPSGGYCPGLSYSWGYTLYSAGIYSGGPFYQNCAPMQTPSNAFSSAFLTVWMTARDSAGNIVCRDSTFIVTDITPYYCGHPDSINVGTNDSTYWPGDTITYTSSDTLLVYAIPTPISDTLSYNWQWNLTPTGGSTPIDSGTSNIIPIIVPAGNVYTLRITTQSQSNQRTRSYTFYIKRRTTSLSAASTTKPVVYPNPTPGSFYILLPDAKPYTLNIYDAVGRKVLQAGLNGSSPHGFSLPAGIYVVQLVGTSEQHVYRLVVQP